MNDGAPLDDEGPLPSVRGWKRSRPDVLTEAAFGAAITAAVHSQSS